MTHKYITISRIKKFVTSFLLASFILIGLLDAISQGKMTYSSIMGMDVQRVYFYTFFLLVIGCWLLYNKYLSGIGFITLATFSSYFFEYTLLHNYFASIAVYICLILDIIINKKYLWILPFLAFGIFQGFAFQIPQLSKYYVGSMEFLSLCLGSVFIVKNIK